ncbi:MAG: DUF308 domain-containing protein [Actinomycetota bacterium]|nr:DUF308 domain-containing protein [Actinomycetota bacterium]
MSSSETVIVEESPDNMMTAIGRNWWVLLFAGILSLAVGVVALVWPGKTVIVVAIVFAIWLIVSGIFSLVRGFAHGLTGGMRALYIITGILSLVLGIFAIRGEFQELYILSLFIGIGFLFRGFASLFLGFESKEGRGSNIFFGIVMIIGGVVVLVWPGISLVTLTWVVGIWLIIIGIYEIIAAFSVKRMAGA